MLRFSHLKFAEVTMKPKTRYIALIAALTCVAGCSNESASPSPTVSPTKIPAPPPLADVDIARGTQGPATRVAPESVVTFMRRNNATTSTPQRSVTSAPVAVVLMERLPYPTASAVVFRRLAQWPHNVIMLREDSLTLGTFGAALKALSAELLKTGEIPPKNEMLQVHGTTDPIPNHPAMRSLVAWELDTLRRVPLSTVQGVGAKRAILIHIGIPAK